MLKAEELSADEAVVTGFNVQRKASFTGTQTTIKKEQLMAVSPTNLLQAIATFEPSIRIIENIEMGSDPNTMAEMYMRGQSGMSNRQLDIAESVSPYETKTNPNLPIIILDGFEISIEKFNDMDMNLIESVTILKDAAATAMYGSRASNGVFVITSVPPQPGKLRFNYSLTSSITAPDLTDYHLLNAEEKLAQEVAVKAHKECKAFVNANLTEFEV
jgi:TonB-dependent SusC/RagA subfamily outer membrane receptor